jgi:hypothetical protein
MKAIAAVLQLYTVMISSNANMYERHDWHRSADG